MDYLGVLEEVVELNGFQMSIRVHLQKADFLWSCTVFDFVKIRSAESAKLVQVFAGTTKGPFLYYVRVYWGFFEPPTHLHKDIFTT